MNATDAVIFNLFKLHFSNLPLDLKWIRETIETANNYEKSFPFELMKKREISDSIDINITKIIA